jgi:CHASE3 domain sensor protein
MTVRTRITLGFGAALPATTASGVAFWYSTTRLLDAVGQIAHSHETLEELGTLLSMMKDAEAGQRGYLLTGDKADLGPYHQARDEVGNLLANLKNKRAATPSSNSASRRSSP